MGLEIKLVCDEGTKKYFDSIIGRVAEQVEVAKQARAKGFDVSTEVECLPVADLAERAETIVGPKGIAKRYREVLLENKGDRMQTLFQIFREMIEQKWIEIPDPQKRVEQAIKTGLVLMTEGVVVSPLDGLPHVLISKNFDGSKYIDIYFSGPIRAAGGSATVIPLILGDYARKIMGLERYKPTEDEVERYVEEIMIYQTEIISRQYKIPDNEIRAIIKGCPVCINGVPTEEKEVAVNRNVERIPSNRIRGGMALVVSEGVALKAMKILSWSKKLDLDWNWLEKIIKVEKTADRVTEIKPSYTYLEGLAAGRPLLAYPSKFGGFRLRYGKARNNGCAAKCMNPATMVMLDGFIAVGTHIKIERPGKAGQIFPCNTIDGPIVLLKNGEVRKINTEEEAEQAKPFLKQILFVGDILITVGDFRKSAHPLVPAGYNEEWWKLELKKSAQEKGKPAERFLKNEISFEDALHASKEFEIPLHPKFLYYFKGLQNKELENLVNELKKSNVQINSETAKIVAKNSTETKSALETIGFPHQLIEEEILIEGENAKSICKIFNLENKEPVKIEGNMFEELSRISGMKIRDKAGTFIGARMGRPEAAKEREMKGNPHVLFPISLYGGATKSLNKAIKAIDTGANYFKSIDVEIATFKCESCKKILTSFYCPDCKQRTKKVSVCMDCGKINESKEHCFGCGSVRLSDYNKRKIELQELSNKALENLGERLPELIKGVKVLFSDSKIPEPLEKGILRAKHNIHIFRDATSRFELLNAPITHFKPKEIHLSVEKIKQLGYSHDIEGKEITSEEQLIEIFPQDAIVNEKSGEWLLRMTHFIDDLLEKFYKLKPFYNAKTKDDLIGELVIGLAPHTSAGIVGRIIGYTETALGWWHPYSVMCRRRNFDGDQDSIMLLMDALINFSPAYLSNRSGGRMDAPLVFTVALNPTEIDDEVYEMESCKEYSLDLFEKAGQFAMPFIDSIEIVKKKLGKTNQYIDMNFTHETTQFDAGPKRSTYIKLQTMEEKIRRQAKLQFKIKAVEGKDSVERVLVSHFFPDVIGNARAFSKQQLRCTKCNSKYRRVPLKGVCKKCNNELILTIAEGSVKKYLEIAKQILVEYNLSEYLKQRMDLAEIEIKSIFRDQEKEKQKSLFEYV
ncbi:MAG: DNA polymerase II large subunit [Candidatus Diapherotrites archaeon]|nr:DNA polymerase II large subunit [Candidatus Diapherotrites archaeon]